MAQLPSAVEAKITNKTTICLKLVIAVSLEDDEYINVQNLQKHKSQIILVHTTVLAFSLPCVVAAV